jgi:hypothetical protein
MKKNRKEKTKQNLEYMKIIDKVVSVKENQVPNCTFFVIYEKCDKNVTLF